METMVTSDTFSGGGGGRGREGTPLELSTNPREVSVPGEDPTTRLGTRDYKHFHN